MTVHQRWICYRCGTSQVNQRDEKPADRIYRISESSIYSVCRQIIVLDDGAMAGIGTHEELLKDCPVYQEIYYSQFPKEAVVNG